jgi:hypothetical protein
MLSRFSISTVAIASLLTLSYATIAAAEVYKTSKGQVVVTGLNASQKYQIKGVTAKNKPATRKDFKDFVANKCGEAVINGAAGYKSLTVGTEAIDPATLTVKEHAKCTAKKAGTTSTTTRTTKKTTKKAPAATTGTVTTPASTTPATGTTGTMTTPATGTGTTPAMGTTTTPSTAPTTTK